MTLAASNIAVMNFHYVRHTLDRFLADVSDAGVSRVELWGAAPHFYTCDKTLVEARTLGRKIRTMGMDVIAFTPEQCIYPINLAAREHELRDRSIRYFLEAMEFATELDAPSVVVTPGGGYRDEPAEEAMTRCIDSMGLLCDRASRLGIELWMETLPPAWSNIVSTAKDMRAFFDKVASPALYGLYDVAGAVMTNETAEDYFDEIGDRIAHVHMTDSDVHGSHLAWGEGIIDLDALVTYLRSQNYEGSVTIELTNWKYNIDPTPPLHTCVKAMTAALS